MKIQRVIELELPLPVTENRYRRYVRGCGPVISKEGRKYRESVKSTFALSGNTGIMGRVRIELQLYPPDRRRRDLDNVFKCLLDSLVAAKIIEDDSLVFELHAYKKEPIPGGLTFVKIESLEGDENEFTDKIDEKTEDKA